uniref:Transmembrane protein n=1 Tax=Strongyloides papillosus TaxID=174720 RepID=A0A0N5BCP7_STREA
MIYPQNNEETSDSSPDDDLLETTANKDDNVIIEDLTKEDEKEEKKYEVAEEIVEKSLEKKRDFLKSKLTLRPRKSIKRIAKFKNWKNKGKENEEMEEGESSKKEYYFIQTLNSFRDISKKKFKELNNYVNENDDSNKLENDFSFSYLVQYKFIVFVQFIQGFLTGLTTAQALSTYLFTSLETFLEGYQIIAVPANATFFILFTLSTILAFENFNKKDKKILSFIYELFTLKVDSWAIFIWMTGSIINLSQLRFDEKIAIFSVELLKNQSNMKELVAWRILGCIRATLSTIGWFLTMKQDKQQLLIPLVERDSEEERRKM